MANGTVNIKGKNYKTVALRVSEFRAERPGWSIITTIVEAGAESVVMKAEVADENARVIGTGYAEEYRASSQINRTSALENCETSAIGRALAACGYGGEEYASANEVQNAISQQDALVAAIKKHRKTIDTIKEAITAEDLSTAAEAWFELTDEEKMSVWVAPTKGGPFTTKEREIMKTTEFRQAYFGPDKEDAA